MKVTLQLFANLRKLLPPGGDGASCALEFKAGATVGQALARLKVPTEPKLIVFVNSRHAEMDQELKEGDVIAAFPPIAGG
jgi:molybdopterin converting factor small subunit